MRILDFSHQSCKDFEYKNQWYAICPNSKNGGWYVQQHPSLWDACRPWGTCKKISGYFVDPQELLRVVTIDGCSVEDILKELPEEDRSTLPLFEYNYDRFLMDILHHSELVFYFREKYYFIDYWDSHVRDPEWTPRWIFIAGNGDNVLLSGSDFDEFISNVDVWMKKNVGVALREMFNDFYEKDMTGDLRLESIYFF